MAKILRVWFLVSGILVLTVVAIALVGISVNAPHTLGWRSMSLMGLVALQGSLQPMAWWQLRSGAPTARNWAIAACIVQLPYFAFGRLPGLAGLVAFSRREWTAAATVKKEPPEPPIPGDGTSKWPLWASLAASIAATWLLTGWWHTWTLRNKMPHLGGSASALQTVAGILTAIVLHETGHVIAGWTQRMKLVQLTLGPLTWRYRGGRSEFSFDAKGLLGGGAAGMVPLDLENQVARHARFIAGGPLASAVAGVAFAVAALCSPGTSLAPMWLFLQAVSVLSVIGSVFNLVPIRAGHLYSDGAQLYQLLFNGPLVDVHLASSMVSSSISTPLRPRDWDGDLLERASLVASRGMNGLAHNMYRCMRSLDLGRLADALRSFERAGALYHEAGKAADGDVTAELMFFSALLHRNPEFARRWWKRVEEKGNSTRKFDYWRARAAFCWLQDDREQLAASMAKAEELARRLPSAGLYDFERESLARLRAAIAESWAQPEPLQEVP